MKVNAKVWCSFTIEYDTDETDIRIIRENIEGSTVQDLIDLEFDDSVQIISASDIVIES